MDFIYTNQAETPIGIVRVVGESNHRQYPPMPKMRKLDEYAIVYLFDGQGRYKDENGLDLKLTPGTCMMLFPDIAHHYAPDSPSDWSEIWVQFKGPVFDLWRSSGMIFENKPVFHLKPIDLWLKKFRGIASHSQYAYPAELVCRLQTLLGDIITAQATPDKTDEDTEWLKEICERLIDDTLYGKSISELSSGLGCGYDYLRKRFTKLTGISPNQYRQDRRIEKACSLLTTSGHNMDAIAQELGFCDAFHFSKTFKKMIGQSPSDFRRTYARQ